jgi:hypothetical protein
MAGRSPNVFRADVDTRPRCGEPIALAPYCLHPSKPPPHVGLPEVGLLS